MSTALSPSSRTSVDVAVIGAGVVGSATALALARRGANVTVLEAEPAPGLAASGTNSGILHTGFDSPPGELETELILRAGALRRALLPLLGVPVLPCGALMRAGDEPQARAVVALAERADANGVEVSLSDGALDIPGEAVTDPVACTMALAAAAVREGATLRTGARVTAIECGAEEVVIDARGAGRVRARAAVNCAGLGAGAVAAMCGDESIDVYPRKGEFLVFEPPPGWPNRILLPVPSAGTKGVLVFPTLDGKVVAGPTAVDQEDPDDWSVRAEAREEILARAREVFAPLADAEPVDAYAGLRPAGRGANYLIERSAACPRLVNAAAIRSTGLTAAPAIAERVCGLVEEVGVTLGEDRRLVPARGPEQGATRGPWWRRTAEHRGVAQPEAVALPQ